MKQTEMNNFKNPPGEFRIIPFWFWNGELAEEEIDRQIQEMADKGLGGFFICPRQGLKIPYLSEQWFERVKFAVVAAQTRNLQVSLYDEYPYPSGMSGGEVILQHPEARQYNLEHYLEAVSGPVELERELPWSRVLLAKAVPVDTLSGALNWAAALNLTGHIGNFQAQSVFQKSGLTSYNQNRYFTYEPRKKLMWPAPAGNWQVVIFLEKELEDFKYFGTYLDPCHSAAVKTFLDTTYERYAAALTGHLGSTVKGMFSDEVGLYGNPPWSPLLSDFFKELNGYSLQAELMNLRFTTGENTARLRYDYFQALHLLLRSAYHQQISEWCEAHHLKYITEVPSVRMTTQLYSHITGGDSAHEKLGRPLEWIFDQNILNFRANPKMVSSLSRQLGLERAFIECFHSVGWSMTLQDAKWMIDRLAAMGINFYNFHAFFNSLSGLRKHDAPPSQFLQNPYWQHFKLLADYAGRLGYALSRGKAAVAIAVLDPTTTLWTHLGNPFQEFKYAGRDHGEEARLTRLKSDWTYICKCLLLNQLDYDHLDPEILVRAAVQAGGTLTSGHAAYTMLILPPMTNLEAGAWTKIKEFLVAGGTVISLGLLPYEIIQPGQDLEDEVLNWFGLDQAAAPWRAYCQAPAENGTAQSRGRVKGQYSAYFLPEIFDLELLALVTERLQPEVSLEVSDIARKSLLVQQRHWPDESKIIFIANQSGQELDLKVNINSGLADMPQAQELELEGGDSRPLGNEAIGNILQIPLRLAPYQARPPVRLQWPPSAGRLPHVHKGDPVITGPTR